MTWLLEVVKGDRVEAHQMWKYSWKPELHGVEKGEDKKGSQKSDVPSSASDQMRDKVMSEERGQVQEVVL